MSLEPMSMGSSAGEESQRGFHVQHQGFRQLSSFLQTSTGMLVTVSIIVAALFLLPVLVSQAPQNIATDARLAQVISLVRSSHLRRDISTATATAAQHGTLQTAKVIKERLWDEGIQFVLLRATLKSAQIGKPSESKPVHTGTAKDALSLASTDPSLIVHKFSDDIHRATNHTLILNKYNTITDHCLIVTDVFKHQIELLTVQDFAVWLWTSFAIDGVGFYNSNLLAGASQSHKHMQIIPTDSLWNLRKDAEFATALEDLVLPEIEEGKWRPTTRADLRSDKGKIYSIDSFAFRHGIVVFDPVVVDGNLDSDAALTAAAEYTQEVYVYLLKKLMKLDGTFYACIEALAGGIVADDCLERTAYNVILTDRFLMLVPRRRTSAVEGMNSMGFFGLLLALSDDSYERLKTQRWLNTLLDYTYPR